MEEQPTPQSTSSPGDPADTEGATAEGRTPDVPAPEPVPVSTQPVEAPAPTITRKTSDERKQLLAQTIQTQIAGGARVESQSDFQAVVIKGHRPNHTLHFIVGLFTLGLWWLVWIGIAIFGGEKRSMAQVDEFGNVTVQSL